MTLALSHPTSDIAAHVESGAVQKGEVRAGPADDGNEARHPTICAHMSDKSQGREDRISISKPTGNMRVTIDNRRKHGLAEATVHDRVQQVMKMNRIARERRQRVKHHLWGTGPRYIDSRNPFYHLVATTDLNIDEFKPRVRDHRERPLLTEPSCTPIPVAKTLNRPFPYSRMCNILE